MLSTRLADDNVERTIDPGAVLVAWRRAGMGATANPRAAALGVARRFDASRLVVGSIVGDARHVIIEGAHIVPGFITPDAFAKKAVIVWIVVQVDDEALHRSHFYVRAHETRSRPVERYLAHFSEIRKIQKYIKSLALQHGVPIISNYNLDACIGQVIEHVIDSAVEAGKGRPQRKVRAIRGGSR